MCRVFAYLGQSALIDDFLYKPDNSLIKQAYDPMLMSTIQNLGGFGFISWNNQSEMPAIPYYYRTHNLPFYDLNLKRLALKLHASCLMAHVRGVSYSEEEVISQENAHPFYYFNNTNIALCHNGFLLNHNQMKIKLKEAIHPSIFEHIKGTTDTEWFYALFLSQFDSPKDIHDPEEIKQALLEALTIIYELKVYFGLNDVAPFNIVVSNGETIIALRYAFNYGYFPDEMINNKFTTYHPMWYTLGENYGFYDNEFKMRGGENKSLILSSEPLTKDTTSWIEVPEYTMLTACSKNGLTELTIENLTL